MREKKKETRSAFLEGLLHLNNDIPEVRRLLSTLAHLTVSSLDQHADTLYN